MVRLDLPTILATLTLTVGACDKGDAGPARPAATPQPTAGDSATAPPVAAAQQGPAPSLSREFFAQQVQVLAADDMQGRQPGTEGGRKAVDHIVGVMKSVGLEPAGEDGTWTQRVPMRAVQTRAATAELAVHGKGKGKGKGKPHALRFGPDYVATSLGPAGMHALSLPLVFAGYGVTAPEQKWDDYENVDLAGKVVVVFVGDPPVEDGRFGGKAMTYYGRWGYKYEQALEAGAAGCLVIHEEEPASYGWNVVENSWSGERFDIVEPDGAPPPHLLVEGWISRETAELLAQRAGQSLQQWHQAAMAPDFNARDTGLRLQGRLETTDRRLADVNVLGRLPGANQSSESVFITAHWDHLGVDANAASGDDRIFNGAIDNASGIAGMLGVAGELAARPSPLRRSVVFLATTAEEQGLLGSRYYAAHPLVPIKDIVAVVNIDSMNVDGATKTIQVVGSGQTSLEDVLAQVASDSGRTLVPDERPEAGGYYRSDHFAFAVRGVPALYFRGGTDLVDGGMEAGRRLAADRARIYHTVDDEFDPAWSFAGAVQDAQAVAEVVARVADAEKAPQWKPDSEFARLR